MGSNSFGFNVNKFGERSGIDPNDGKVKGGLKKENVDERYHSIFDKVDVDKNGILDDKEAIKFNELKKNNNVADKKNTEVVNGLIKNKDGKFVQKQYIKIKDLPEGRLLVADKDGKQWVMAKDGVILKESYAKYNAATGNVAINQQQKNIINARYITSKIEQENREAKIVFDKQMKEDGIFEDIADGVSTVWGSDNRASVVRQDFKKLDAGLKKMNICLKRQDMQGFRDVFKDTYGVDYNEQNINEYYKHPTPENRKKAFGESRVSDIRARIDDYAHSQETGGQVVKGVAVAAAAASTGGASIAGFAVASGIATVGADVIGDITKGEGHEDFDIKKNLSQVTDQENLIKYGRDGVLAAGAAYVGGQVGKTLGNAIGNKIMAPKLDKVWTENTTNFGQHLYINEQGIQILQKTSKIANSSQKVFGYTADSTTSSVVEAAGDAVNGGAFGTSLEASSAGVLGDGIAEGGKKVLKTFIKKSID